MTKPYRLRPVSALPMPARPRFAMRQRYALSFLAEHADLILVEGTAWLLAPAPAELVNLLACLHAREADLEPDADLEPGDDEL